MPARDGRRRSREDDLTRSANNALSVDMRELLEAFFVQSRTVAMVLLDDELSIRDANPAMLSLLRTEAGAIRGRPVAEFLTAPDANRLERCAEPDETHRLQLNFVDLEHSPTTLQCLVGAVSDGFVIFGERATASEDMLQRQLLELNNTLAVLSRENSRRKRELAHANEKLEETLEELNSSFWHLRKISEVLPICVECGKVKTGDDETGWESVVDYLREHSLFLSHGYCPDCTERVMDGLDGELEDVP